ncbi:hypothetical protein NDU88_006731 [Pleurodeles waltl]|uniref:Uncharacterized protein n=1 Tax=Pleurodeles waltl TaxID=8319 RepID=A0AAV7VQP6_PLEWA|nr:hypothetical protein NDU88_006731 [Pleurodeles waltl]
MGPAAAPVSLRDPQGSNTAPPPASRRPGPQASRRFHLTSAALGTPSCMYGLHRSQIIRTPPICRSSRQPPCAFQICVVLCGGLVILVVPWARPPLGSGSLWCAPPPRRHTFRYPGQALRRPPGWCRAEGPTQQPTQGGPPHPASSSARPRSPGGAPRPSQGHLFCNQGPNAHSAAVAHLSQARSKPNSRSSRPRGLPGSSPAPPSRFQQPGSRAALHLHLASAVS